MSGGGGSPRKFVTVVRCHLVPEDDVTVGEVTVGEVSVVVVLCCVFILLFDRRWTLVLMISPIQRMMISLVDLH